MIARVEPITPTRLIRGPFDYCVAHLEGEVAVGSLLRVPFGRRRMLGVVVGLADDSNLPQDKLAEPEALLATRLPDELVALARWLAEEYCSTVARALALVLPPGRGRGIRRLCNGRAAGPRDEPAAEPDEGGSAWANDAVGRYDGVAGSMTPELTPDQHNALREVVGALSGAGGRFLLHGVTGSGKTEVYLRAVEAALAAGRGAIVLVPEIALTPQALERFRRRFGDQVAALHSALRERERREEWLRLQDGRARICIGPRSAVFAPLEDVGLIVIDEEHDGSYKHEGDPRYDARVVAARRAQVHGAVLLAGSATPRPESFGALQRLRLPSRIDRRPLPPVEVLDMRGLHHPLHPDARLALADVRQARQKAIVLINRRGWSNFLVCRSCGHVPMCPSCDVALVLHRAGAGGSGPSEPRREVPAQEAIVACHHCGHRERLPDRCSSCGSIALARHGAGTERLEQELLEALGDQSFPIFRLDADAVRSGRAAQILARFGSARAGVLVGTQMVAKGHDFPEVTLGVVIDADQTLRFPDFRAEERTFALLTQLAGRAGRGDAPGRVLVQTLAPSARSIALAARHDTDGFLVDELERRRALGYPPFGSLIRIVCSAPGSGEAVAVARELHTYITDDGAVALGPAPLFRLRGRARSQLVVKSAERAAAVRSVSVAVDRVAAQASRRRVSVSVDVDPQ